jgi:hypothetical protein
MLVIVRVRHGLSVLERRAEWVSRIMTPKPSLLFHGAAAGIIRAGGESVHA